MDRSVTKSKEMCYNGSVKQIKEISLWDEVFPYLEQAVAIGLVSEEVIDRSVLRILELKSELGLFSSQSSPKVSFTSAQKETLCTALAEDSLVLLKNDNILPLKKEKLNQIDQISFHDKCKR